MHSPVALRIGALPEQRLPDPVEVTVYYLVAEALSNAVKHAGASELRVDVTRRGPVLYADVADDGAGGATPGAGSGLHGLVDRLEALGGRLEVESAPGAGTRLRASIPIAPWRDGREPFIEFGYEGDGGRGERAIAQILDGSKTASVSLAREWDLDGGPPRIGQRLPITDHHGNRRAVVEVTRVAVLPFGQIDEDTVIEGERGGEDARRVARRPPRVLRGLPRRGGAPAPGRARLAPDGRRADGRHVVPPRGRGGGLDAVREDLVDRREAGLEAAPRGAQVDLPDAHPLVAGQPHAPRRGWTRSGSATPSACGRSPCRKPSTWRVSKPVFSIATCTRERCSGAASGNT